jgi:hypothetical protein
MAQIIYLAAILKKVGRFNAPIFDGGCRSSEGIQRMDWKQLFTSKRSSDQAIAVQFFKTGVAISYRLGAEVISHFLPADPEGQNQILKKFVSSNKLSSIPCTVILEDNYKLLLANKPNVLDSELDSALPWLIKDLIDFPITEAIVASFPLPLYEEAEKIYAVIAKQKFLFDLRWRLKEMDLYPASITIIELSLLETLKQSSDVRGLCGLIYWKQDSINLLVSNNGVLCFIRKIGDLSEVLDQTTVMDELQRSLDYAQVQLKLPELDHLCFVPTEEGLQYFSYCQELSMKPVALSLENLDSHCLATQAELMRDKTTD